MLSIMTLLPAQQMVRFDVQLPKDSPTKTGQLFLAGDFNGWHTADKTFELKRAAHGRYTLRLALPKGQYAFKVVRGDWKTVEVAKDGSTIENRTFKVGPDAGTQGIQINIANWADNFVTEVPSSTAAENVHVLDTAFWIPQLARKRRIWIYLPTDYDLHRERYPVLYLQDGQNVFDAATSFSGEWGVDEYLNSLRPDQQCIVVAIDNGGNDRMQEYNPYRNKKFGKGEGAAYVRFLTETLKPYIDAHYRTKKQGQYTAVAGSSMGGLISFYAAITYPDVFGTAGIFSPSFWIAPEIYPQAKKQLPGLAASAFYFYGGGKEDDSLEQQLKKMEILLSAQPGLRQKTAVIETGQHNEKYWQQAFPGFYEWWLKTVSANYKK